MNLHQHRIVSMRQHFDSQEGNSQPTQSRRSSFSSTADSDIFSQTSESSSISSQSTAASSQFDFSSQGEIKHGCDTGVKSSLTSQKVDVSEQKCLDLPAQFSDLWTEVLQPDTRLAQISPPSAEQRCKIAPRRTSVVSPSAERSGISRRSSLARFSDAGSVEGSDNGSDSGLAQHPGSAYVSDAALRPSSATTPPNAPQLSACSSPASLSSATSSRSATSSCAPSVASTTITTPSSVSSLSELSRTTSHTSEVGSAQSHQRVSHQHGHFTHPRRTSLTQGWCKPSLTRQDERRQGFVEHLVDAATQLVAVIWPSSSSPSSSPTTKDHGVYPLRLFIREVLRRSRASYSTLQVALFYLVKIKLGGKLPNCDFTKEQTQDSPSFRSLQCGRRMFLASLILASKYLQDRNFSAKAWSKISGLGHAEISMNEMSFLDCVEWNLHIKYEEFQYWSNMVVACTDAAQQGKRCPWRNVLTCVMERTKRQRSGIDESQRNSPCNVSDQTEEESSLGFAAAFAKNDRVPLQFEDSESWKRSLEGCMTLRCNTEWPTKKCLAKADERHQSTLKRMVLEPHPLIAPPTSQLPTPNLGPLHSNAPAASARVPNVTPPNSELTTPERTLPPLHGQCERGSFLKRFQHGTSDHSPMDYMELSQRSSCTTPSSAPQSAQPTPATLSARDSRACSVSRLPTPTAKSSGSVRRMIARSHSQNELQQLTRNLSHGSLTSEIIEDPHVTEATCQPHRNLLNPGLGVASTSGCREHLNSLAEKKRRRGTCETFESLAKLRRTSALDCKSSVTPRPLTAREVHV